MKYFYQILFAVALLASSFTFSEKEKSTFDFLVKKTENKVVDARFQLTSNIDYLQVQKTLLQIETISEFNEISKKDNYYQLKYQEGTSLDQLRKVFLSYGVDFDRKHVLIVDKSYYQN